MDSEPQDSSNDVTVPAAQAPSTIDVTASAEQSRSSSAARGWLIALVVGLVAVFAMQVFTLISASQTDEQIAALEEQIDSMGIDLDDIQVSVNAVDQKVDDLATGSLVAPAAIAPSVPAGYLPPFEGEPDDARDVVLGDVTGVDYYSETEMTIDPADGTARAWLIWAHWCPYCQQELPPLSEWYTENADLYPNVELISVTSSIDPARGNPLEPYLDELQLPFPAILDPNLALAEQFGLSAYPFWVFTSGDGKTQFRTAGLLGVEQIEKFFAQLEALPS